MSAEQKIKTIRYADHRTLDISYRASQLLSNYIDVVNELCYRHNWILTADARRNKESCFVGCKSSYKAERLVQYDPFCEQGDKYSCKLFLTIDSAGKPECVVFETCLLNKNSYTTAGFSFNNPSSQDAFIKTGAGKSTAGAQSTVEYFELDAEELDNPKLIIAKINALFIRVVTKSREEVSFRTLSQYDFDTGLIEEFYISKDMQKKRLTTEKMLKGSVFFENINYKELAGKPALKISYQVDELGGMPHFITIDLEQYTKNVIYHAPDGIEIRGVKKPIKPKTNYKNVYHGTMLSEVSRIDKEPRALIPKHEKEEESTEQYETIFDWD